MADRWIVERLDGPIGERVDGGIFEGDTEQKAIQAAMDADDREGEVRYRISGPLPSGFGMLAPAREYRRDAPMTP